MREVIIPITASTAANVDIALPGGVILDQIISAVKFVGSDGTAAAIHSSLGLEPKGDGSAGAGKIRLQADGRRVRCGDALDTKCCLIITARELGDILRP